MRIYTLRDPDSGVTMKIKAFDLKDAREYADDWALDGDYNLTSDDSTIWVDVQILDADGDHIDTVTTEINPPEPDCDQGQEHDWRTPYSVLGGLKENPGVWGHGGGVISKEVCARCGVYRISDSWAQRPDTGEQGLNSVTYEPADDESAAWLERRSARADR